MCLVVFDKILKAIKHSVKNLKHFCCSRVWWEMFCSFGQPRIIHVWCGYAYHACSAACINRPFSTGRFVAPFQTMRWYSWEFFLSNVYMNSYYMASSASGQDESKPALWLATRAGKMELSCPLGITRHVPQEKFPWKPYNKSFINQACSVKLGQ